MRQPWLAHTHLSSLFSSKIATQLYLLLLIFQSFNKILWIVVLFITQCITVLTCPVRLIGLLFSLSAGYLLLTTTATISLYRQHMSYLLFTCAIGCTVVYKASLLHFSSYISEITLTLAKIQSCYKIFPKKQKRDR